MAELPEDLVNELKELKEFYGAKGVIIKKGSPFPILVSRIEEQHDKWDVPDLTIAMKIEESNVQVRTACKGLRLPPVLVDAMNAELAGKREKNAAISGGYGLLATFQGINLDHLFRVLPECVDSYLDVGPDGRQLRRYSICDPPEVVEELDSDEERERKKKEEFDNLKLLAMQQEARLKQLELEKERKKEESEKDKEYGLTCDKAVQLSKKEKAALNPSNKEKSGHRTSKTGPKAHKPIPKEDDKKK